MLSLPVLLQKATLELSVYGEHHRWRSTVYPRSRIAQKALESMPSEQIGFVYQSVCALPKKH